MLLAGGARTLSAQDDDPVLASRAHYAEAVRAYDARDFEAFLQHAAAAHRLRPAHGGVTYALASAHALVGDTAAALATLRRFASLGYSAQPAADSDFVALHGTAALERIERRLELNREPVIRSALAFTLPESDLLAEGIAYDPREGTFYVGSVHRRKVVRMTRDGRFADFVTLRGPGRYAPLGLAVDPARRALWVATAAVPQMAGYTAADSGRSALLRFDLDTGEQTGDFPAPSDGRPHALGDLVISRAGDVYATDSRAPVVYRVRAQSDSLEPLLESPLFLSAQGLALSPDERRLFVADYSRGIVRVDLAAPTAKLLPAADSVLALGIDGLYYHAGTLIGIQNGVTPHRVVRLTLGPDEDRLLAAEPLERAHPAHEEPTLGTLVGRELYYIANSQWERFDRSGGIAHPDSLRAPVVLRLRL